MKKSSSPSPSSPSRFCCRGCLAPTQSTSREYDAAGNVIKETVTSKSIVKTVAESTKDKLVYLNGQSWLAGIRAIPRGGRRKTRWELWKFSPADRIKRC